MNNSNQKTAKKSKIQFFIYGLFILMVGVVIGFFIPNSKQARPEAVKTTSSKKDSDEDYISSVKKLIETKYYKPVDNNKLVNGSVKGMLDSLDDPYTTYLDKKAAQSLNDTISSSIVGIGVTVLQKNKLVIVDNVIEGGPAKKAGIKSNDIIVKVDGKSVIGKETFEITKLIRGKKGTPVEVTVKRDNNEINFNMTRDTIPLETVKSKMLDKEVGSIQVSSFSHPTTKEFKKSITDLREKGAKKFIIDMRGNPGGELQQALSMSSMFLKDGQVIIKVQGRKKDDLVVYRAGRKYDQGFKVIEPTVVLIDSDSASASEIFAAALQDNHFPVVGETSFGKGTVQSVVNLPDDAELKMTVAKWLTPSGTWINKKGIKPDYKVDYPEYSKLMFSEIKKPLKQGDVSSNIKSFQKGLSALGFAPGNEKGIFDEQTEKVVKEFQAQRKITVNGTIDKSSLQEMFRALNELVKDQDMMTKKAIEILQK